MKVFLILISIVNVTNVPHYKTMFKKDVKVNVDGENEIKITEYNEPYNSNHFYDIYHKKYVKCPDGQAKIPFVSDKYTPCDACDIYHKYVRNGDSFYCIKCPENTIAKTYNGHRSINCLHSYSNEDLMEIYYRKTKYKCTDYLENSVGRKQNTPPIFDYCQCPNSMPRVEIPEKDRFDNIVMKYICLTPELPLKYIDLNLLDYAVYNYISINETYSIRYRNCNPYRDYLSSRYIECLCPPEQIYSGGKCKICIDSDPFDSNNQVKCKKCSEGKILTLNGKECMCPYSDVPQSKDCNEATENEKFCSGNLVLNNGRCILCPKNQIKSEATEKCICPKGRYIDLTEKCVDCNDGLTTNEINQTSCLCPKGKYIDLTRKCVDCNDGLTTNEINQTSCNCPEGKYINSHEICVECPIGTFSQLIDAKKCINCVFFKTTESTKSNTKLKCNKINYINIAFIIGFIVVIILICSVITILIILMKSKNNNQNNNQNNQVIIQADIDPNQYEYNDNHNQKNKNTYEAAKS